MPSQYWHDILWSNWSNNLSSSYTQYENQGFREVLNAVWPDTSWTLGGNQTLLPEWIGGPNWTPNMDAAAAANELVQYQYSFNSVALQARQNPAAPGFPPFVEHIPPDQPVSIAPFMPSADVRYTLTVEAALWDGAKYAFETSFVFICDVSVTNG